MWRRTARIARAGRNCRNFCDEKAGGLMSYSADILDLYRRSAAYIDKILKGADPSELPVEQASKYKLVINLETARALGLEIPPGDR
jgi:putative tryptophan/tyrosine transport system substrate-binding protein